MRLSAFTEFACEALAALAATTALSSLLAALVPFRLPRGTASVPVFRRRHAIASSAVSVPIVQFLSAAFVPFSPWGLIGPFY